MWALMRSLRGVVQEDTSTCNGFRDFLITISYHENRFADLVFDYQSVQGSANKQITTAVTPFLSKRNL